ncbi:MAG: cell division protein FtsZ [Bacteroidia bacterium]|nr:cell division protein FtsZ [Bacteroidia bacterium]MDW8158454.1 cell division protein FtsZ [Bacteroidia bacterium]
MEFITPTSGSTLITVKVIGVGGGGGNAVNNMYNQGITGVDFIIANTDRQVLEKSPIPYKIQLGPNLTGGLGAGGNPEVGKRAAQESIEEIRAALLQNNTRMVFITAGMGGGTGTGAAPVIARTAKEMGILTVAVVTTPFTFEGQVRMNTALQGIEELKKSVDTLLVIKNANLSKILKGKENMRTAYNMADQVLCNAVKGIAEIITVTGFINVDFSDVQTIMKDSGKALMGLSVQRGESRAQLAVEEALNSPLLDEMDISGATGILINVTASEDSLTMEEFNLIGEHIRKAASDNARIIFGQVYNNDMGDALGVTIIATGFGKKSSSSFAQVNDDIASTSAQVNSPSLLSEVKHYPTSQTATSKSAPPKQPTSPSSLSQTPTTNKLKEIATEESSKEFISSTSTSPISSLNTPPPPSKLTSKTEFPTGRFARINPEDRIKKIAQQKYDLTNPNTLQQLDEHPAYERRGVDIDFSPPKPQRFSRFSVGPQSQGGFSLRDNSFIFDNVD